MDTTPTTPESTKTRLERPNEGRVLSGVSVALADKANASVSLVRLGFLVAALFGGFGIVLYATAWVLIPSQDESESAAGRWLENLTTPGKRAGAFLVGLAALIILANIAPATILVVATLLAAAALLSTTRNTTPVAAAVVPSNEETE